MQNDVVQETILFDRIAEGDETAFETLFHLYAPRIQPVIRQIIQEDAPVKDIIQEVFLGLWLGRDKLPTVSSPRNWIFKITYHRSYSWLQKQDVREKARHQLSWNENEYTNITEDNLSLSETSRLIREAIEQLPPQALKIYRLSRENELKIADIAHQLDVSVQTVKNSLVRSLRAIREYLLKHGISIPLLLFYYTIPHFF
ncbi:RNA polymerase sigma factor [Chitinophaga qingshengii]|uniref:Sigma-70 family RNA polymerase sigma factor n=1 Tax=Chitinophaga qingshengii TaxID=1569794 RepID=A0ABR7TPG3_9BACT|nr:sigma-70 family RNA polymerase sigma factor [Chitinophaga qingshengii]MBC9932356.1 sigma-70 family RNA polymerase sigma factor [Chitinophaga qingshengii]